jgi:hypothetical protein
LIFDLRLAMAMAMAQRAGQISIREISNRKSQIKNQKSKIE